VNDQERRAEMLKAAIAKQDRRAAVLLGAETRLGNADKVLEEAFAAPAYEPPMPVVPPWWRRVLTRKPKPTPAQVRKRPSSTRPTG
jgi:hypothetical protein